MTSEALLSVKGLRRGFYGVTAIDGLDFDVRAGTISALVGPNGAGKTTAFQCISGVVPPHAGVVTFDGEAITAWPAHRITRRGLLRTFQIARGVSRLTVLENLLLYAPRQSAETIAGALVGSGRDQQARALDRAWTIATRLNLARVANNAAAALSGGQKKLLEIGRALMGEPRMIMLDEPFAGVNPTLSGEIGDHILRLREEGVTFLMIEHHMDMVSKLCDPVIVMAEGKRLAEGAFREVAAMPSVQEAYMGRRA